MRAAVALLLVLAVAGCSGDDGDDDGGRDGGGRGTAGCLVDPDRVEDLLGYEVVVDGTPAADGTCRFEPADPEAHPGAFVVVAERELADDDEAFEAARAAVEADAGPTTPIGAQDVARADRGWIARVGRVVQVGAVRDRRLVQVTVVDADLDRAGAEAVAFDLADRALG